MTSERLDNTLKYTLAENAISSLHIAIENFKTLYYHTDEYGQSIINESAKICVVFLENAIELMLKTILVSDDPLSIYEHPDSQAIKKALLQVNNDQKLEDILLSQGNFKTIAYTKTIEMYNDKYHNSQKVYCILKTLGEKRNDITHFGIDASKDFDEFIILLCNAFDVIYNYLYPQLIALDDIGHYFTSDDLIVDTIHGEKFLFDDDFIYNNIIDFLDELMEMSKDYICSIRTSNPKSRIVEAMRLIKELFTDRKFHDVLLKYNVRLEFHTCDYESNDFYFAVIKDSIVLDEIGSRYSPYFNTTIFSGENGEIYFLIVHSENELYIYNQEKFVQWPEHDEPELDFQWISDCQKGLCSGYNLSKRNLLRAFECLLQCLL